MIFWDTCKYPVETSTKIAVGPNPASMWNITTTPEVSLVLAIAAIVVTVNPK